MNKFKRVTDGMNSSELTFAFKDAINQEVWLQHVSKKTGYDSVRSVVNRYFGVKDIEDLDDETLAEVTECLLRHEIQLKGGTRIHNLQKRFTYGLEK